MDSKPDSTAFEKFLAAYPGRVDLWIGTHTHTDPDDTYGRKSHIEKRWGDDVHQRRGHPPVLEHRVPRSGLLTFTDGNDEVTSRCHLHSDDYALQGWYAKVERTMKLSKPFKMQSCADFICMIGRQLGWAAIFPPFVRQLPSY